MNRYQLYMPLDVFFEIDFPKAVSTMILDTETGDIFPADEENRHYRSYLEWVAEGNPPAEGLEV